MIGLLHGTVRHGCVMTDCGVGYVVHTVDELTDGDTVELLIHQTLSESSSTLYGFVDEQTRDMFVALCKVPKVAGKTALSLLQACGTAGVARAQAAGDVQALCSAKGVGKKLAEAIVATADLPDVADDSAPACVEDDLVDALAALGIDADAAAAAAAAARRDTDGLDLPVDRQLKIALAHAMAK